MTKNPFDPVFEEIAKLMKFAYENAHKPVSPEKEQELNKKLDEIEKQVAEFEKQNSKLLADMGVSEYKADAIINDPQERKKITPEQNEILTKGEKLKNEALTASVDIQKAIQESENAAKNTKKGTKKPLSPTARKGKFRGMGGDQKWQKL